MKAKKLNLANIQGKLSRSEMKNIMAGSDDSQCGTACADSTSCTLDGGHSGHCHMPDSGANAGKCFCVGAY
jgi:natural product precursor